MASSPSSSLPRALSAIKRASTPQEAMWVYKNTVANRDSSRLHHLGSHAAVFVLKACCSHLRCSSFIRHLHAHILKGGHQSHVYVSTALLHGYVLSSLPDARALFDEMPNRNIVTANTMVSGYGKNGDLHRARLLFDEMPDKDIASWSAMIGAYIDKGKWQEGFHLFRDLILTEDLKPDQLTLVPLISFCASKASPRLLGKSIHAYIHRHRLDINMQLGTSLIDMYAKSGCLKSARLVFDKMREKNVMPWSAMICGLAMHGHGEDAMMLFNRMKDHRVRPNEITFTGVLNACCHAGLVDEGRKNFHAMVEDFGITPSIHHYGCMVELLGKAGMIDEAYDLTKKMKDEPNIVILTSLLASCKTHRNLAIAEKLIGRVLRMASPEFDGGVYILVADLYAMAGRWDDAEHVRKMMDREFVKKKRGLSSI